MCIIRPFNTIRTYILITFIILVLCGCSSRNAPPKTNEPEEIPEESVKWYSGAVPFEFNIKNEYPETDIRLSDLAEITYVSLGTNDHFIMHGRNSCNGGDYFLTHDRIYMLENEQNIFVFDAEGKPVRHINRKGNGPEEYVYIRSFTVDTVAQELFILDARKKDICVYDTAGIFKRRFPVPSAEIKNMNDSLLLCFNQYNPGGPRYMLISKTDGTVKKEYPVKFYVKLPDDSWGRLAYGSTMVSPKGVFLSNLGNDTIFEVDKTTLDLVPRIVDKSDYGTNFAQIHPTIETNEYLLFYILRSHNYPPAVKQYFYVYDKREQKIYKIKEYADNDFFAIMEDYPHITNWEVTHQANIAIRSRLAYALMESLDHCHGKLKEIAENLDEESNPVLIKMTFKEPEKPF